MDDALLRFLDKARMRLDEDGDARSASRIEHWVCAGFGASRGWTDALLPLNATESAEEDPGGAIPEFLRTDWAAIDFRACSPRRLGEVHERLGAHRKPRGLYYTPQALAAYMAEAALEKILRECESAEQLRAVKVVDPACGCGALLIEAFAAFLAHHRRVAGGADPDAATRMGILRGNLFGMDIDGRAVAIAKLALLAAALDGVPHDPALVRSDAAPNIRRGDALAAAETEGGFDCVLANPPYVDSETMSGGGRGSARAAIAERFATAKGNWDMYVPFIEKGMEILKPGGFMAVLTPDKWISKPFGRALRKTFLPDILTLTDCGRDVFGSAKVDAIVTVFRKGDRGGEIASAVLEGGKPAFANRHAKTSIPPPWELDFLFSRHLGLLEKIAAAGGNALFTCENACAVSDAYKLKPMVEDLAESEFDPRRHLKIINTGTVGRYQPLWGRRKMAYLGGAYLRPAVAGEDFFRSFGKTYAAKAGRPKLIIKGLSLLDASLDAEGEILPGKTTLVAFAKSREDLLLAAAFLNSRLLAFYLKERHSASSYNGGITFTKDMLNRLPIPAMDGRDKAGLIALVRARLCAPAGAPLGVSSQAEAIESDIENRIRRLYGLDD
jgi:methylase of polypeptide subunit release factors